MPYEKSYDPEDVIREPGCIHLRSKAMYVTGQFEPEDPDEAGSKPCWCNITQHVIGPDKLDVDRRQCIPGRSCFEEAGGS